MNTVVADYLVTQITSLAFTERVAGIVRIVSMQTSNPNSILGVTIKKFPVSCNVSERDCQSNKQHHLVPDKKLRSLIYFEDGRASPTGKTPRGLQFRGRMRLVCWLNLDKLGQTNCNAGVYAQAQLIGLLDGIRNKHSAPLANMSVDEISIVEKSAGIFTKFSYREEQGQFLLYPYDYFAFDLTLSYEVPFTCINDDWLNTEIECTGQLSIVIGIFSGMIGWVYSARLTDADMILNWWYVFCDQKLPQWIAKPICTCYKCVSGQIALWWFVAMCDRSYESIIMAALAVSISITTSLILNKYVGEG